MLVYNYSTYYEDSGILRCRVPMEAPTSSPTLLSALFHQPPGNTGIGSFPSVVKPEASAQASPADAATSALCRHAALRVAKASQLEDQEQ
jgi:hypothetical protein